MRVPGRAAQRDAPVGPRRRPSWSASFWSGNPPCLLSITLIDPSDRELLVALRTRGYRVAETSVARGGQRHVPGTKGPDVFLVDTRALSALPREICAALQPPVPGSRIVVLAKSLDPSAMLDAMRMGITEWLPEPVAPDDLDAAHPARDASRQLGTVARPLVRRASAARAAWVARRLR